MQKKGISRDLRRAIKKVISEKDFPKGINQERETLIAAKRVLKYKPSAFNKKNIEDNFIFTILSLKFNYHN